MKGKYEEKKIISKSGRKTSANLLNDRPSTSDGYAGPSNTLEESQPGPSSASEDYEWNLPSTSKSTRIFHQFEQKNGRKKKTENTAEFSKSKSRQNKSRKSQMSGPVESCYKELLNPIKELEKSFSINISELLWQFVSDLIQGKQSCNFNSAALILQGSASIYGKKVEFLHGLTTKLHDCLRKHRKNEEPQQQQQTTKRDTQREKERKANKLNDPFISIEIKPGKNLSCLKRKNNSKVTSKKVSKKRSSGAPIHLLSNDIDEKGEVFYDTRGEVVGNKGDFAINKCRLIDSGWLLLPTVNPQLVPPESVLDGDWDSDGSEVANTDDDFNINDSPDDGFESCPSSDVQQSAPTTTDNTENSNDVPMSVDEGVGETPAVDDSPGIENIPANGRDDLLLSTDPQPVRQSGVTREALKPCQLSAEDDPLLSVPMNKDLLKKKAIGNRNVHHLPEKLRKKNLNLPSDSITVYCARTFFSLDAKTLKSTLLNFDSEGIQQNSLFLKRILGKMQKLKEQNKMKTATRPNDDSESVVDVEGIEVSRDADDVDDMLNVQLHENEFHVQQDFMELDDPPDPRLQPPDGDNADPVPAPDMPSPDIGRIAQEEVNRCRREIHNLILNSDITERVREWENNVRPFLDEMEHRGNFDINMYGGQIINSFENNNRKQTKTFREICRNKEKWEVHRYFMAVLPLANMGNVSLEKVKKPDGSEDISITLLSRKMHHLELENFGHNNGEHS